MTQKVILTGEIDSIELTNLRNNRSKRNRLFVILRETTGNKINHIPVYFNFNANKLAKAIKVGDRLKVKCVIHDIKNGLCLDVVSARIVPKSTNRTRTTIRDVRVKILNMLLDK